MNEQLINLHNTVATLKVYFTLVEAVENFRRTYEVEKKNWIKLGIDIPVLREYDDGKSKSEM